MIFAEEICEITTWGGEPGGSSVGFFLFLENCCSVSAPSLKSKLSFPFNALLNRLRIASWVVIELLPSSLFLPPSSFLSDPIEPIEIRFSCYCIPFDYVLGLITPWRNDRHGVIGGRDASPVIIFRWFLLAFYLRIQTEGLASSKVLVVDLDLQNWNQDTAKKNPRNRISSWRKRKSEHERSSIIEITD